MASIISLPRYNIPLKTISTLIIFLLQLLPDRAHRSSSRPAVPAVIVFGDSVVDPGNNNYIDTPAKGNFPPYGQDFPGHEATGRFSNGRITPDMMASALGVKELVPAYFDTRLVDQDLLTGVSFASAASGFDPLTSTIALAIPMMKQLDMFKEYKEKLRKIAGKKKAASIISESLYMVCSGSNDVAEYFLDPLRRPIKDIATYSEFLMQTASNFLQELVNLGARRVGVTGLPPIGCLPSQRTLAGGVLRRCAANRNDLAKKYNEKLKRELNRLTAKDSRAKLIYVDMYSVLLDLIQKPQKYGFRVSKRGCCGTGTLEVAKLCNRLCHVCSNVSKYLFWDSYHPTERAYKIIVDKIIQRDLHLLL
ncbi:GDSL esterase/lipase At1g20120-like [Typha latifolia]|uniref:GDSL esterase/lipase At1g20120-like n=1 Tax=Typha latifolia TaxID=4733 RepID=UPI003C2BE808